MKQIVEGNKALKKEMSQKVELSMELKEEEMVSLLLRSMWISVKKGGKDYLKQAKISEARTTYEIDLQTKLEQERAKNKQLTKVEKILTSQEN